MTNFGVLISDYNYHHDCTFICRRGYQDTLKILKGKMLPLDEQVHGCAAVRTKSRCISWYECQSYSYECCGFVLSERKQTGQIQDLCQKSVHYSVHEYSLPLSFTLFILLKQQY